MTPSVEELYKINKELKKENVQNLQDWLKLQPHLPPISEYQTILFLHSCFYNNEATKVCIDNYYTCRKLCPEFFANRNPKGAEVQQCMKTKIMTPLPKLTPEGYLIYYHGLIDTNPDTYDLNSVMKLFDMMMSLSIEETGTSQGHVIVVDLKGTTLTHMMKMNIMSIKKYLFFLQEALPVRLKEIHYVNAVSFMDKLLSLFKPFMKKEMIDMLRIHDGDNSTIFKMIPKDCLPSDIGGTCGSVREIHERYMKHMQDNATFFIEEEKQVVDESKRQGKPKNAGDLFGVEGTFKKLDLD